MPLWLAVFAAIALTDGLAWSAELWTGSVLLAAGAGFALALIALAGRRTYSGPSSPPHGAPTTTSTSRPRQSSSAAA